MVTTERLTSVSSSSSSPSAPPPPPISSSGLNPSVLNTSALWKRDEQLRRWQDSETNLESSEPKRSGKVNFQRPCIFLAACSSGDQREILSLLRDGVDINTANVDGMTALHQACIDGNFEIVKFLCSHGADVDYQDNEGWSPLHAAASCSNLEITKYLVEAGADLTSCTTDRELAVDLADGEDVKEYLQAEMNRRGIDDAYCRDSEHMLMLSQCKQLIAEGGFEKLKCAHPKTGATVLHIAAAKGYDDVLKIALETGIDPNCKDAEGWTPLHAAAHWDNVEAAKTLMDYGADCDAVNNAGHQVWDVCEEAMFATLINYRAELKNRAAAKSLEIQRAARQRKESAEMQKPDARNSAALQECSESSSESASEQFEDVDRNRSARDVTTPARELGSNDSPVRVNSMRKNERIGRLQESLRTLSERFKSNANEVSVALNQTTLEGAVSTARSTPTSENVVSSVDESSQVKRPTDNGQRAKPDLPLVGDFVASRRTRFETVAKEATTPIRRLGGVVKSESEESASGNGSKSWGSCVGSLRFDSNRPASPRRPPSRETISRFEQQDQRRSPAPESVETSQTLVLPPGSQKLAISYESPAEASVVRKKPASVIAGVTAVTVSSPPPLTVTANVSVSSNSSSSPPESASRAVSGSRASRAFPSSKDEQAEAERKKRSAKARRERRSTQGVSREDLAQAIARNSIQSEEKGSPVRKPNRWTEAVAVGKPQGDFTSSKPPVNQFGPGVSAIAKPIVIKKSEELSSNSAAANESTDDMHGSHKRKQKTIQRRPTGRILWQEENRNNNGEPMPSPLREWDTKPSLRFKTGEDTVDDNNTEERNFASVAVQTADGGFLEKFSLCQLKTRCQELTRENDRLSADMELLRREIYDKDQIISKLKSAAARIDQTDRRRVDSLRADNTRLKEENAALIRVISKMSKQS